MSEQTPYRDDYLANRSQENLIWFVLSLSLGFDIYKSSEIVSYCFEIPIKSWEGFVYIYTGKEFCLIEKIYNTNIKGSKTF